MNSVKATTRNAAITLSLLLAVLFAACFALGKWLDWKLWDTTDLGHKLPTQVFQKVFHMPVPAGVTRLKIEGFSSLSGDVWMRLEVTNVDAVIRAMKRNKALPVHGPTDDPNMLPQNDWIRKSEYAKAVGWGDVVRLKQPEYYDFPSNPPGTGWTGALVVDRKRKLIYIYGELL
jgi:hypothetical protein